MDILDIARLNQQRAWKVVEDSGVIPAWESIGAEINLVGSLSTGLLMTHRDLIFIFIPLRWNYQTVSGRWQNWRRIRLSKK